MFFNYLQKFQIVTIFRKKTLLYYFYQRELPRDDFIVCNSNSLYSELSQLANISERKIRVVKNGVDQNKKIQSSKRKSQEKDRRK